MRDRNTLLKSVTGGFALAIFLLLWTTLRSDPVVSGGCAVGKWEIKIVPSSAIIRRPYLTSLAGKPVVSGNAITSFDSTKITHPLAYFATPDGAISDAVPSVSGMMNPVVSEREGGFYVAWGETLAPVTNGAEWDNAYTYSVWVSDYSHATGFGRPAQIYAGSPKVDVRTSLNLFKDSSGSTHLMFMDDKLNPSLMLHTTIGSASIDTVVTEFGTNLSALAPSRGRLAAAYIGFDKTTNVSNVVWFTFSEDGGKTWSTRNMIPQSANGGVDDLVLLGSGRALIAVWVGGGNRIVAVRSADYGRTWSEAPDLIQPTFINLRAALDRCGNVHVVYEHEKQTGFAYARLDANQWSDVEVLLRSDVVLDPAVHATSDGVYVGASAVPLTDGRVGGPLRFVFALSRFR